jgi:hypothetical protein
LQPLPNLPGFEVPEQQPRPYVPGSALARGNHTPIGGAGSTGGVQGTTPGGNGTIIVPNGNGTSTVISPTGAVTTIPTPGK